MELLAPAGNMDMLYEAVYNGANAVYLGLDQFNARIKADNFTKENIGEVVTFCHLHDVKVYVVINISVKNNELSSIRDYITACNDANIDAFIVSDIGLITLFNELAPAIPLHASTQMAIHNVEGARIAKRLGFSRVVVARETLYEDIKRIKSELGIEVEYFVHGALCVAFSGNCLFSSIISGNSGNRGRCLQPCRQLYTCNLNDNQGYLLSPKDQCLVTKIDDMRDAGIDSLKIEGRLKSRNYVSSVVRCYRYALDTGKVDKVLYNDMLKAFNRGEFTKGYNYDSTKSLMSPNVQGNIGLKIGHIIHSNDHSFEVETSYPLKDKNGIKILSLMGMELGGMRINGITPTKKGYLVKCNKRYPVTAEVRITLDDDIATDRVLLPIDIYVKEEGQTLAIVAKYRDIETNISQRFDIAEKKASTRDDILSSMSKLGDSEYRLNNIEIEYNDDLFLPKSMLNGMRRSIIQQLNDGIIARYNRQKERRVLPNDIGIVKNTDTLKYSVTAEIDENTPIDDYMVNNANIVVNSSEFCISTIQSIINNILIHNKNAEILLKLPNVARGSDIANIYDVMSHMDGLTGVYADNLYAIEIANHYNLKVLGGLLLNIYNTQHVKALGLTNYMLSAELNLGEMRGFGGNAYVFAFGYLPIMTLTHCPVQLNFGCTCANCVYRGSFHYDDRMGSFAVRRTRNKHCIFTLYNSKKHNIISKSSNLEYNFYINLVEFEGNIDRVMHAYVERDETYTLFDSTYGHLMRGVK